MHGLRDYKCSVGTPVDITCISDEGIISTFVVPV